MAAWGLCKGSGANPYQVAVDIAGPAYKCSCPSRKIPCKHALGLLFLVADGGAPTADPPDWAQSWLEGRASRAATAATRAERPTEIDPEARAKRIATRERKVAAGIDELDRWLRDLMRRGLDSTRSEGYRFWDAMGARLVDAQAGGLGRSVRGLGSAANSGDAWPHLLLEGAGRLHLLSEAYRRADQIPDDLRADVRSLVGWNVKEDELDPADAVEDRWLVIGQRIDDRGDIVTARTFLLGETSRRLALHLAFGVGAAPPTLLAIPGQAFRATMTFYPSSTPLRAAVRPPIEPDGDITDVPGAAALATVVEEHAARLARNPFAGSWPVVIGDVVPVLRGDQLLVRDPDGTALPLIASDVAPRLFAVSGGHPVTLVAEWDGNWLRPLAAFADGHLASVITDTEGVDVKIDDPDWSALVSAALLGTERTGGNAPIPATVAALVAGAEAEQAILVAAGTMALRRRAGRTTTRDEAPLPQPAEPDPHPQLTGAAARYVGLGFDERPSLAPEILELVRGTGRRLPDEWLPDAHGARQAGRQRHRLRRARRDPRGVACPDISGACRGRVVGDGGGLGRSLGGGSDRGGQGCAGSPHSSVGSASGPRSFGELVGSRSLRTSGRARSKLSKCGSNRRTNPSSPRHSPIEGPTCAGPHWASWCCSRIPR